MSKISFIDRCLAYLKSDDKSIVTKVVIRATKVSERNITNGDHAIADIKLKTKRSLEDLQDKLEAAKESLANSHMEINLDACKSPESIESFVDKVYLPNIAAKMSNIKALEDQIKATTELETSEIKTIEETASLYKKLLEVIQADVEA